MSALFFRLVEDFKREVVRSSEDLVRRTGAVFAEGYRPGSSTVSKARVRKGLNLQGKAKTDCSQSQTYVFGMMRSSLIVPEGSSRAT